MSSASAGLKNSSIGPNFCSCFLDIGPRLGTKNLNIGGKQFPLSSSDDSRSKSFSMTSLAWSKVQDLSGIVINPIFLVEVDSFMIRIRSSSGSSMDVAVEVILSFLSMEQKNRCLGEPIGRWDDLERLVSDCELRFKAASGGEVELSTKFVLGLCILLFGELSDLDGFRSRALRRTGTRLGPALGEEACFPLVFALLSAWILLASLSLVCESVAMEFKVEVEGAFEEDSSVAADRFFFFFVEVLERPPPALDRLRSALDVG
eukprot:CAMPEP_0204628792 /NCGR_PEP_ID=MMETSP0717-20131115/16655_1 /ASSEMBLY_ACC=CAM_ASM_000666 /TAXON_ID=230516 /ORGANISM="Chaetoceros curvisetus" /LENGTH=260 /DNA_ID=CAMNT_0051645531 /DNA_START=271 /DNA_END=1050 /DNA_ORIENTATION=+